MKNTIKQLKQLKARFQPYIKDTNNLYTFIAPKEKHNYDEFIRKVSTEVGHSLSFILRNEDKVDNLIEKHFSNLNDFDLYIISEDKDTQFVIDGTVRDYIKKGGIDFEI